MKQHILYQNIFPQSAWENESYGKYYFGPVDVKGNSTQHDNLLYFGLFLKSSVTSDYNELSVSVTHVPRMIFYLSLLCVLWTPQLLGGWGGCTLHIAFLSSVYFFNVDQRNHCHLLHNEFLYGKLDISYWDTEYGVELHCMK